MFDYLVSKTYLFAVFQVPLEGFKALQGISGPQRFQIHKAYGAPDRLPSAHTWSVCNHILHAFSTLLFFRGVVDGFLRVIYLLRM